MNPIQPELSPVSMKHVGALLPPPPPNKHTHTHWIGRHAGLSLQSPWVLGVLRASRVSTRKETRERGAHRSLALSPAALQKMESLLTGYHCSDTPSKVLKQLLGDL